MSPASQHPDQPLKILLWANFGPMVGIGHLIRCATVAEELTWLGWNCTLACRRQETDVLEFIQRFGFSIPRIQRLFDDELPIGEQSFDCALIDQYDPPSGLVDHLRKIAGPVIRIVDFLIPKVDGDILICPNDVVDEAALASIASPGAVIFHGAKFSLVRRSIRILRNRQPSECPPPSSPANILVTFGGTDITGDSQYWASQARMAFPDAVITVVTSSLSPGIATLSQAANKQLRVLVDVSNMAELIDQADFAIGTGGVGLLERCCVGIPGITQMVAENQRPQAQDLAQSGATLLLDQEFDRNPDEARRLLNAFSNPKFIRNMAIKGRAAVDGRGIQRWMCVIVNQIWANYQPIKLRLAEVYDRKLIFEWQSQPGARAFSRNPSAPTTQEHNSWFDRALDDPERWLLIIEDDGRPVGFLRLDAQMGSDGGFEISIILDQAARGRGIAKRTLKLIAGFTRGSTLWAEIDPRNFASVSAFVAAGFEQIGPRKFRHGIVRSI